MTRVVFAFLMAMAFAAPARAHSYHAGSIDVGHIWAPPSKGGKTSIYMPLLNNGKTDDALSSATSAAGDVTITSPGKIDLPPGQPISVASWSTHLDISKLKTDVKTGDSFPLTLVFDHAGQLVVEVQVENDPREK